MAMAQEHGRHELSAFFVYTIIFAVAPMAAYYAFCIGALVFVGGGNFFAFMAVVGLFVIPPALIAGFAVAIRFHRRRRFDPISLGLAWTLGAASIFALYPFASWVPYFHMPLALALGAGLGITWLLIVSASALQRRWYLGPLAQAAIILVLSIPAADLTWSLLRIQFFPHKEAAIRLPIGENAVAYVQEWWEWDDIDGGEFWLAVETPQGRVSKMMWKDWGPAVQANLYITPENYLVVIGGGGTDTFVRFAENKPELFRASLSPEKVWPGRGPVSRVSPSEQWTYLGVVYSGKKGMTFHPPGKTAECIDLYGAGDSPYRKQFQQKSC